MTDRTLPPNVYRLPTMMITFNKSGQITETYGFDEQSNNQVSLDMFPILAIDGFLSKKPMVMPLSLEDSKGNLHCNAIVIMNSNIERFEPRGNIKDKHHTSIVQSFYDPTNLDSTLSKFIKGWFSPRNFKLDNITRGKSRSELTPYFRYMKPKSTGIVSTDTKTYGNAAKCSKLTFDYLRIRVGSKDRSEAYKKWLNYELQF